MQQRFFSTQISDSSSHAEEPINKSRKTSTVKNIDLAYIANLLRTAPIEIIQSEIAGKNEYEYFLHGAAISEEERRIEMILLAVQANHLACLTAMAKDVQNGGLGWSINVKHSNGQTPLSVAIKSRQYQLLLHLVMPVAADGFGLHVDVQTLRSAEIDQSFTMYGRSNIRYRRQKLTRQTSYVEIHNAETDSFERFTPTSTLSEAGSHSHVRKFTSELNPTKHLVVKQLFEKDTPTPSDIHLLVKYNFIWREIRIMQMLYPELSPFKIKDYVGEAGQSYNFRAVMPFVKGRLWHTIINEMTDPEQIPLIILAIAKELQRIHLAGIVHRDIKPQNVLIDVVTTDIAPPEYQVTFIDFEFATGIGKSITSFQTAGEYIAPELHTETVEELNADTAHDIFSFAFWVNTSIEIYNHSESDNIDLPDFRSIDIFTKLGTSENPEERPKLNIFIEKLTEEINAVHSLNNYPGQ